MTSDGIAFRETSLRFKAHVGMLGTMSISADLRKLTDAQKTEMIEYGKMYKAIRHTVHTGDFSILRSVYDGEVGAYQYISKDKKQIIVFLFGLSMQFGYVFPRIKLDGLDPDSMYKAEGYKAISGRGLMEIGLGELAFGILKENGTCDRLRGDFSSYAAILDKI